MWIDCFNDGEFTNDYKIFIKKKRFNIKTYDKEEMINRVFAFHDELAKNLKYKR